MIKTRQLVPTDDVITEADLIKLFGFDDPDLDPDELNSSIQVCDGVWVPEGGGKWRFWAEECYKEMVRHSNGVVPNIEPLDFTQNIDGTKETGHILPNVTCVSMDGGPRANPNPTSPPTATDLNTWKEGDDK